MVPKRCALDGCDTILSRYNDLPWCSVHERTEFEQAEREREAHEQAQSDAGAFLDAIYATDE